MGILGLWIFLCLAARISSKVFVVKDPSKGTLKCISEDDGSAMVLNNYGKYKKFSYDQAPHENGIIDCDGDQCRTWLQSVDSHWTETNSLEKPMGPVFDSRWEGFEEVRNSNIPLAENLPSKLGIFISSRMSDMEEFLLCSDQNMECVAIKYSSSKERIEIKSFVAHRNLVLGKCVQNNTNNCIGVKTEEYNGTSAIPFAKKLEPNRFSEKKWITMMIDYDFEIGSLKFSEVSNSLIIKPIIDRKNIALKMNSGTPLKLTYKSNKTKPRLRLHRYNYTYTNMPGTSLKSPDFDLRANETLFVRMSIAVCKTCQVTIKLKTNDSEIPAKVVVGSEKDTINELPMWQQVPFEYKPLVNIRAHFIINTSIHAVDNGAHPIWALGSVHQYESSGGTKRLSITYSGPSSNDWEMTCQKFFGDEESQIVDASMTVSSEINLEVEFENCPAKRVGPRCIIDCHNPNCEGEIICESDGCTCATGYIGSNCTEQCGVNTYGHGCTKQCGHCLGRCDIHTGMCSGKCNNADNIYMQPSCTEAIGRITNLTVNASYDSVNVILGIPNDWMNMGLLYRLYVKEIDKHTGALSIQRNDQTLKTTIGNLKAGEKYTVYVKVSVEKGKWIEVGEQQFNTICDDFKPRIIRQLNSAQLTCEERFKAEHVCISGKNYRYLFVTSEPKGTWKSKVKAFFASLTGIFGQSSDEPSQLLNKIPLTFLELDPNEMYQITVIGNGLDFHEEFGTLKRENTKVRSLNYTNVTDTGVTISWEPPKQFQASHGYTIQLMSAYQDCNNATNYIGPQSKSTHSTPKTHIRFENLHPHRMYSARIAAYEGAMSGIEFMTLPAALPTTSFLNVEFNEIHNTLRWQQPNCSLMTGTVQAATLILKGISENVEGHTTQLNITNMDMPYNLNQHVHGAEMYEGRLYPKRNPSSGYNNSVYTLFHFTTLPKAPPVVSEFDVWEVDINKTIANIKWKPPLKPSGGEIEKYIVQVNETQNYLTTYNYFPNVSCSIWPGFICTSINFSNFGNQITVIAKNKNVSEMGVRTMRVISQQDFQKKQSKPPEDVKIQVFEFGIMQISWSFPERTFTPIQSFVIEVEITNSTLKSIPHPSGNNISLGLNSRESQSTYVKSLERSPRSIDSTSKRLWVNYTLPSGLENSGYQHDYFTNLTLLPSTDFNIVMYASHKSGMKGIQVELPRRTPSSLRFDGEIHKTVDDDNLTISLTIPSIVNDTRDSKIFIIMISSHPCTPYEETWKDLITELKDEVGVKPLHYGWPIINGMKDYAGKNVTIGGETIKPLCSLKHNQLYVIMVIVQSEELKFDKRQVDVEFKQMKTQKSSTWYIWVIMILLLIAVIVAVWFYSKRRQRKKSEGFPPGGLNEGVPSRYSVNDETEKPTCTNDKISRGGLKSLQKGLSVSFQMSEKGKKQDPNLIKINDFENYVKHAIKEKHLDRQYKTYARGCPDDWDYGALPQNKNKNRYMDLIAYDKTRVVLEKLPEDPYSDYINASYIKGLKGSQTYIAAQGPKSNTVNDFWRMIWQRNCRVICMLTNVTEGGKAKCEKYWPGLDEIIEYDEHMTVENVEENVFVNYTIREFEITLRDKRRRVHHLHFTTWPDHGVPKTTHPVVSYLRKLMKIPSGDGPIVVHCSAGVGRTGSIIVAHICSLRAVMEGVVDVFSETANARTQRANMVDNEQQYAFIHLVLIDYLLPLGTPLSCEDNLAARIKQLRNNSEQQRKRIQERTWLDKTLNPPLRQTQLAEINLKKNRYPELTSGVTAIIFLPRYPKTEAESYYISAVYVAGVKGPEQYIASQLPLPSTLNDFWRMIAAIEINLIIVLQAPDLLDSTCCEILPQNELFKPTPFITVKSTDFETDGNHTVQKSTLMCEAEGKINEQSVTILTCTQWKSGLKQSPPPASELVSLWEKAMSLSNTDKPVVTLCHDGVSGCGLYLSMSHLLERMKNENEFDICLAVRAVQQTRSDFVNSSEQFKYLHDAAVVYSERVKASTI